MPAKKTTTTKKQVTSEKVTKTTKQTKSPKPDEVEQKDAKDVVKSSEPQEATVTEKETDDVNTNKGKKSVRKAGRTLLVKALDGKTVPESEFDSLVGLTTKSETKSTNSFFLTFDTVQNALDGFRKLRTNSQNYRVKFSYYRVFFTVTGLTDESNYNQVKSDMIKHIESVSGSTVLYCKLYQNNSKFIGCGDFTLDTLEGMNKLIAKDSEHKNYTVGSLTGTFYRYNAKKGKDQEQTETA